ncbi:MAG: hypothetical protein RJA91_116 [Pseudomonadota bacterium]|jgi:hypothetical protein
MITNFETETCPLSEEEKQFVKIIIRGLETKTKENPIKSDEICEKLNEKFDFGCKMTGVRLRKITNFIRSEGILPIIATSNGYYCSYDRKEIEDQIKSLNERAEAIKKSADGLKKFLQY